MGVITGMFHFFVINHFDVTKSFKIKKLGEELSLLKTNALKLRNNSV